MDPPEFALAMLAAAAAFTLSSAAGLGGSLILVPALALVLGAKEGIALAALLLASNNAVKLCAYRHTIPWASSAVVIALTIVGAALGARLLVEAPSGLVETAVIARIVLSVVAERWAQRGTRRASAPGLAFAAGPFPLRCRRVRRNSDIVAGYRGARRARLCGDPPSAPGGSGHGN